MANRPSQLCRVCRGRGWFYVSANVCAPCELCHGGGRITIKLARILKWLPIVHKKRIQRAKQLEMMG